MHSFISGGLLAGEGGEKEVLVYPAMFSKPRLIGLLYLEGRSPSPLLSPVG